ncbi:hypothetical protein GGF38_000921 [Coemansia sp. RSA 25]|nr:hypothetical protein GGF38_000921 [Coemansia sp. RSA 25]
MDSLVRDCEKLAKHQTAAMNKTLGSVEATILALEKARPSHDDDLAAAQRQCKAALDIAGEQLKELSTNVAKYGKHVERAFKLDLGVVAESRAFDNKRAELGQAITQHFLQSGDFELARSFIREEDLNNKEEEEGEDWARFEAMAALAGQIGTAPHELGPALAWAQEHSAALAGLGQQQAGLEFALHRLRFLQLIEEGGSNGENALEYARDVFPRFSTTTTTSDDDSGGDRLAEVAQLMGVLMYARRAHPAQASPYAALFSAGRWAAGARQFAAAFCAVHGLPQASALAQAAQAGALALAVVGKAAGLLRERRAEWSQQDELATEVALPDSLRFHAVFACPVSKEQASRDNPPMALPCGHVVCKASLDKLARGTRPGVAAVASGRFKCPYCPGMATVQEGARVYF